MKEYEISNNEKVVGKAKIYNDNIKFSNDTYINSLNNCFYHIKHINKIQTYEISITINNVDDLYDIVSKYSNNVFDTIEQIKKYNNIKSIKKNTKVKIIIPRIYLNNFNIDENNIDKSSLFQSKVYFIKKVLETNNFTTIKDKLDNIINEYNEYINEKEYDFYTDDEKSDKIDIFLDGINELIKQIELNTNYKYGESFIIPIKIINDK